jgi:hypothetical protein
MAFSIQLVRLKFHICFTPLTYEIQVQLISHYLITFLAFGNKLEIGNSELRVLHHSITSFVLGQNIILSAFYLSRIYVCFRMGETSCFIATRNTSI